MLQAHAPIKLKKPQHLRLDKMAAKAITGMGSAAKSVRGIVKRRGDATGGLAGTPSSTTSLPSESENRIIYVSTHAEGVTRVCLLPTLPPLLHM